MLDWVPYSNQYICGLEGKKGKYNFFRVFYDSSTSKTELKKYRLKCTLPGFKTDLGLFLTESEAKIYADSAYSKWLRNTELQEVDF